MPALRIAPSVLSADFACLRDQVRAVESAGADQIHVDVMDGHFVPNLTMGPLIVEALRRTTELPLDVHLMLTRPDRFLAPFVDAGANHVSFHVEAEGDHREMFAWLAERGIGRGVALNPETPVDAVLEWLPLVDMVVVMTVHPGFGGQKFLAANLDKVRRIREEEASLRKRGQPDRQVDIQVDGGVDRRTIVESRDAGANVFVAGSSIFGADPAGAVRDLRESLSGT